MVKKFLNSKLGQQIMKFGVVGLLCFAIEYVLLIVIKEVLGWNVILANTIAFTVSAVVNYILSIVFVFDTDKKANKGKQFAVFFLLAVGGLIINNIVLKLGTMVLDYRQALCDGRCDGIQFHYQKAFYRKEGKIKHKKSNENAAAAGAFPGAAAFFVSKNRSGNLPAQSSSSLSVSH